MKKLFKASCLVAMALICVSGVAYADSNDDLFNAATKGNAAGVKKALKDGANVNFKDKNGVTALMLSSNKPNMNTLKVLLENGAQVNDVEKKQGLTTLLAYMDKGNLEMIKLLVEKGADVNKPDLNGATPLIVAADFGRVDVAKFLLEKGAKVNAARKDGLTPIAYAAMRGNPAMTRLLIDNKADVNAKLKKKVVAPIPGSNQAVEFPAGTKVLTIAILGDNKKVKEMLEKAGAREK